MQYHQSRVSSITELERRLESSGYGVGFKVLELLAYRSLKSKLVPNGATSKSMGFRFLPDLESALGRAENGLLKSVMKVEEYEMKRLHRRRLSMDEDGFEYSLRQIDQQVCMGAHRNDHFFFQKLNRNFVNNFSTELTLQQH